MEAFERAWSVLKRVVLPESKEHWSPDLINWHLRQREWDPSREDKGWHWDQMERPSGKTTHGFHGEPLSETQLSDSPPMGIADVTTHTDEEWQKKIRMREADDENTKARLEWYEDGRLS